MNLHNKQESEKEFAKVVSLNAISINYDLYFFRKMSMYTDYQTLILATMSHPHGCRPQLRPLKAMMPSSGKKMAKMGDRTLKQEL